jgi:hypothetical protein
MLRDYENHLSRLSFTEYWQILIEIGWLKWIPPENRDDLRVRLQSSFSNNPIHAYSALVTSAFDGECIYDSDPEGLSYHNRISKLSEHSRGVFRPDRIIDVEDLENQSHKVGFEINNREYICNVVFGTKWFNSSVIDLINQALTDLGTPLRYIKLPSSGQVILLTLIPEEVFISAIRKGLIPPSKYDWYKEHQPGYLNQYLDKYYDVLQKTDSIKILQGVEVEK